MRASGPGRGRLVGAGPATRAHMIPLHDDNPSTLTPVVSWTVLAACILVFLWQVSLDERAARVAIYGLGMIPAVLFGSAWLQGFEWGGRSHAMAHSSQASTAIE